MSTATRRALGVAAVFTAMCYIVVRWDFEHSGIIGLADDFFIFMAAFTVAYAQFTKPVLKYVRHQLHMISITCLCLGIVWVMIEFFA